MKNCILVLCRKFRKWAKLRRKETWQTSKCFSFIHAVPFLFHLLLAASLLVISVANLALLSTNISKSTSVHSVASAFMSSQSVVLETTAGWLTSVSAVRKAIPVGLTSGKNPPRPLTLTVRYWEHSWNIKTDYIIMYLLIVILDIIIAVIILLSVKFIIMKESNSSLYCFQSLFSKKSYSKTLIVSEIPFSLCS